MEKEKRDRIETTQKTQKNTKQKNKNKKVFFSQTDFGALGHYLGTMFWIGASGFIDKTALYYLKTGFILLLISILMCRPAPYQYFKRLVRRRPVAAVIINLILFALSIAYMVYNSYTPFLYAKF